MYGCSMNKSYCEQKDVTLVWETTKKTFCNLQEGKTVVAQMMRDDLKNGWMMTSEIGQFTQTEPLIAKWMCGIPDIYPSEYM